MRFFAVIGLLASVIGDGCVCTDRSRNAVEPGGEQGTPGARDGGGSLGSGGGASSAKCIGSAPAQGEPTVQEVGGGTLEDRLFGRTPAKVDVPAKVASPCP